MIELYRMVCENKHPWCGTRNAVLKSTRCPLCGARSELA